MSSTPTFRLIQSPTRQPIKTVLATHSLHFVRGRAFYEIIKRETIQDYKLVVVMRKSDGAFVQGDRVRQILRIPRNHVGKYSLNLEEIPEFSVFVQSTSHNRVIDANTRVLYRTAESPVEQENTLTEAHAAIEEEAPTPTVPDFNEESMERAEAGHTPVEEGDPLLPLSTHSMKTRSRARRDAPLPKIRKARVPRPTTRRAIPPTSRDDATSSIALRVKARRASLRALAAKPGGFFAKPSSTTSTALQLRPNAISSARSSRAGARQVDVAFSFDTTGSMYPCLAAVRANLQTTIARLHRDVPSIRMAVIAHGDYCDRNMSYVTQRVDFTNDAEKLCDFVRNVTPTGGGDFDECYELVLREARTELSWAEGEDVNKALVVIGDATPHEPWYCLNTEDIDWRDETDLLKRDGVKVYGMQVLNHGPSTPFYKELASRSGGIYLKLEQFSSILDFMLAIVYNENGADALRVFEDELRGRGMNRELHRLFDQLSGRETAFGESGIADGGEFKAVSPSRFQMLTVDCRTSIQEFVRRNELAFYSGRGFYEFTKPEVVSDKKEVVLVERTTGDMFTGPKACELIGAGGSRRIKPNALAQFRVFVQSTSYNRVLVAGTGFLYEMNSF